MQDRLGFDGRCVPAMLPQAPPREHFRGARPLTNLGARRRASTLAVNPFRGPPSGPPCGCERRRHYHLLIGTFHALDERTDWLATPIRAGFDSADELGARNRHPTPPANCSVASPPWAGPIPVAGRRWWGAERNLRRYRSLDYGRGPFRRPVGRSRRRRGASPNRRCRRQAGRRIGKLRFPAWDGEDPSRRCHGPDRDLVRDIAGRYPADAARHAVGVEARRRVELRRRARQPGSAVAGYLSTAVRRPQQSLGELDRRSHELVRGPCSSRSGPAI